MGAMKQLYTERQEAMQAMSKFHEDLFDRNDPALSQTALRLYMELRLQRERWIGAGGHEDAVASIDKALASVE